MNYFDLSQKFNDTTENQEKDIFNTLFIAANKLQTLFDSRIPEVSLKQFMLLSTVRHLEKPLTFTQLGCLLGCSRQNIKKLAESLKKKGFITIEQSPLDSRAMCVCPTEKADAFFQHEFAPYQQELQYLFAVYTEEEIAALFHLLTKLYEGISHLETVAAGRQPAEKISVEIKERKDKAENE